MTASQQSDDMEADAPDDGWLRELVRRGPTRVAGRYEVVALMAAGGMAEVYRVRDPALGRELALKVVRPEVLAEPPAVQNEYARRLTAEAALTARLAHPSIVPVHDRGILPDGRPWFVMKLIDGRTLREELAAETPRSTVLAAFERVCDGVAFAHAAGVVHRDIKPENVMVGKFGEVQVMDWGIAKDLRRTTPEEASADAPLGAGTAAGRRLGTAGYMPPEQVRGDVAAITARSDVYALGAVLCELLAGAVPADSADAERRLADLGESDLADLARRCLAADPIDRPADAAVVRDALREYAESVREELRRAELAAAEATAGRGAGQARPRRPAEDAARPNGGRRRVPPPGGRRDRRGPHQQVPRRRPGRGRPQSPTRRTATPTRRTATPTRGRGGRRPRPSSRSRHHRVGRADRPACVARRDRSVGGTAGRRPDSGSPADRPRLGEGVRAPAPGPGSRGGRSVRVLRPQA